MISLASPLRWASPEDADALARLINYAGEGLPEYLWQGLAEPGETPMAVGRRRARRDTGGFSYKNAILRDATEGIVACLIGYALPDQPEPIDHAAMPPMFVPLQELENVAVGTWYVNVLATEPAHRGRGFGTHLLTVAEEMAGDLGKSGMSIIVSDGNPGACRLYERMGYRQTDSRQMVKEAWTNAGSNWVLLTKAF